MALAQTRSSVLLGVNSHLIDVHVSSSTGLPQLSIVGLPDTSMNESPDRVRSAIVNSGFKWPQSKIIVGLSPAGLPKRGPGLDVAIALGILAADGQIPLESIRSLVVVGELSLDGRIHSVPGALATAIETISHQEAFSNRDPIFVCGLADADFVSLVPGLKVIARGSLAGLVAYLLGSDWEEPDPTGLTLSSARSSSEDLNEGIAGRNNNIDLAQVSGQSEAKLALEVAAAGGHHLALLGRAGVGKTLIAERLPGILPDLAVEHSLEVTSIHQLAGEGVTGLVVRPPWCAPHHTASSVALVGGGTESKPRVGLVSLAHRGVLFLDEAAEFEARVLDAMREPLESGRMSVARAGFRVTYPARFQLVIAANPCPCGFALDPSTSSRCQCTPIQRRRYAAKLSGPLLDRMDLRIVLSKPTLAQLKASKADVETSEQVRNRVVEAREIARQRLQGSPWSSMSEVPASFIGDEWPLPIEDQRYLDRLTAKDSMRGRERVLRLMWTLADLEGLRSPKRSHIDQAFELRSHDLSWGT